MLSKSEFERNEDTDGDQIVAIFKIYEGRCNACKKRWTRVTYEWDGGTYRKIKLEETLYCKRSVLC